METNQQNQDEIEIDLLELLRVLWSKIGYVILAALALGLLMVLVSKVFMKPQYESTTKMYVLSKQDSSSTVTSGDLQASSLLTKDYAELIQSRQVVETVIAQLNLDLTVFAQRLLIPGRKRGPEPGQQQAERLHDQSECNLCLCKRN